MASVRARSDSGLLMIDFRFRGVRCRELTALSDAPTNRKRLEALAKRIQKEIDQDTFDYQAYFPNSPKAAQFANASPVAVAPPDEQPLLVAPVSQVQLETPVFSDFAELWFIEMTPQWKPSHRTSVRHILNRDLLPVFGARAIHTIGKADVLAFRAELSRRPGRKGATMGPGRINKIMCFLRQVLNEAADRYDFPPAFRGIRPIKQPRADVQPFSLDEVQRILETVRADYRDYLTVRFFTGMRTCEVNGLKWEYVDLEKNLILVREANVEGEQQETLKTESSHRDIPMFPMVRAAIENRLRERRDGCEWVFASAAGNPVDGHNFCNRVWYPLLRYLNLAKRRPYQTRHTAATLMLAAGESPEWIAQVMGHSTTAMLFKVYSRFVPNLTRMDGRAFAGLIHSRIGSSAGDQNGEDGSSLPDSDVGQEPTVPAPEFVQAVGNNAELASALNKLSAEQLTTLVALAQQVSE